MASTPVTEQLPIVLRDVTTERMRQLVLGWTPEHDDQHHLGHLVDMARVQIIRAEDNDRGEPQRRELVQAIALLCATVESLDRREASLPPSARA